MELYELQVDITGKCNFRCRHCRVDFDVVGEIQLSLDTVQDLIRQAAELECERFIIGGGEPMMHRDWYTIARCAHEANLQVVLLTNGWFMDDTRALKCQEAGIDIVQVSVDGASAETHDYIRRMPGSFNRAIAAIERVSRLGIHAAISMTVNHANLGEVEKLAEVASAHGAHELALRRFIPHPAAPDRGTLDLTREDMRRLLDLVSRLKQQYRGKLQVSTALMPFYILDERDLMLEYAEAAAEGPCAGCAAGVAGLYVAPDGSIHPCPYLDMPLGNIRDVDLRMVMATSQQLRDLGSREHLQAHCSRCSAINLCGGCLAYTWAVTGDLYAGDPLCPKAEETGEPHAVPGA